MAQAVTVVSYGQMNNGEIQSLFGKLSSTLVYAIIGGTVVALAGRLVPAVGDGVNNVMDSVTMATSYVGIPFDWLADKIGGN